jgi:glycosyltransferase involved in cell wall biosynthesis
MPTSPTTSVLIPTFNRGRQLAQTIESIFAQTVPVTEVIVVDDGSTDDTRQVIEALLTNYRGSPTRLQYFRQENQGKSVALNLALAHASGEWIAYNDSDDLWRPDKLEWQWRALAEFPRCRACFTDANFVNNPEMRATALGQAASRYPHEMGQIDDPVRLIVNPPHGIFMQTILVHRDVMKLVGEFDPRLWVGQDTDFVFRLAQRTPLCYVNLPLVDIDRSSERSIGLMTQFGRRSQRRLESLELIYQKWLDLIDPDQTATRERIRGLQQSLRSELSNWHLLQGDAPEARVALRRALRGRFSARLAVKLMVLWAAPDLLARKIHRNGHVRPTASAPSREP